MLRLHGNYMIGKILDKFYVFHERVAWGGVSFSQASDAFHTIEDAHLYLLEQSKEESTPDTTISVVEVQKNYMWISETADSDAEIEVFACAKKSEDS